MFDKHIYKQRRDLLRKKMRGGMVLVPGNQESPMNYADNTYHFRQDSTFLYFFGLDMPGLFGVIDMDDDKDYIFGDDVDIEDIIWMGPQIPLKEKAKFVGVKNTDHFGEVYSIVNKALWEGRRVHFLPPYRAENKLLLKDLLGVHTAKLPDYVSLELIKNVIDLRAVKDEHEIAELTKACNIGYEMHVAAMKMAWPGVVEQQIAGAIEGMALSFGGGTSFPVILTQNGQTLHNHDHSNELQEGRLMLTDAGAQTNMHYASDITRTVPVGGKFSTKQRDIYNIVLEANNTVTASVKPGETYLSLHLKAAEVIANGLKGLGLMKGDVKDIVTNGAHAMFMPHGIGHMIGLDVHDMEDYGQIYVGYDDEIRPSEQFGTAYLRLGRRLQSGFVITNEPGIYFIPALIEKWKNEKINIEFINFSEVEKYIDFGGIRLEDDILVTENGGEVLGERAPITVEEVESAMGG
jgi:Xaa-Pro aminopeptidase